METTKTCTKCERTLPIGSFNKKASYKDGVDWRCRACSTEAQKIWRAANRDKERESRLRRYAENPEKFRAARRAYIAANRDKVSKAKRARRAANLEKYREESRAWNAANAERCHAKTREWRKTNREKIYIYQRARIDSLADSYVCETLRLPTKQTPLNLIEAKRAALQIKRMTNQLNKVLKEKQNGK